MGKKSQTCNILESGRFWLFLLITFFVILDVLFFPNVSDFWELLAIVLWRWSIEKTLIPRKILLISASVITLLMPLLLAFGQATPAKEFAVWLFYIFIFEIGLEVWKLVKHG
jgi:hypothetical protein